MQVIYNALISLVHNYFLKNFCVQDRYASHRITYRQFTVGNKEGYLWHAWSMKWKSYITLFYTANQLRGVQCFEHLP